ncbi:MspA family protein OS=Tsukamurella paurometabola (strain ATCC 8368 / DSM / CCUG 35730 / CIP 100753 / JCM 10117 / KCTC 9821 / NBRC 16120 / NCIMB 702349/ NCTC 13040) OX=521096 GN=Tpau_3280 PE=4 SV=1 [Tsukamurella paurometabola]|uniref:MspA family protein n=2 Tax=Tsukamurella paurometabola TaxID=2061 RepID=D5UVT3_TSUPD|nr:MspA family protein [Tsukamurella paurometabola DSM 20162]SUP37466.1 MspA [Tsukamurella paurometabola]
MNKLAMRGAAVAAAGAVLGAAAVGPAVADTVIPLGVSTTTQKVGDANITVTVKDHSARLSPGMVSLPTTRNAWVSGLVSAKINGGKADGGSISAGYAVGCQVDVGAAQVNLGARAGVNNKDGNIVDNTGYVGAPSVSGSTGGSLKLAAGSIGTQMLTYDRSTWPSPGDEVSSDWADPSTSFKFSGANGSLSFQDQTIGVDGCAGYAQAKFFAKVKAKVGNTEGYVILWGKPFTLG